MEVNVRQGKELRCNHIEQWADGVICLSLSHKHAEFWSYGHQTDGFVTLWFMMSEQDTMDEMLEIQLECSPEYSGLLHDASENEWFVRLIPFECGDRKLLFRSDEPGDFEGDNR